MSNFWQDNSPYDGSTKQCSRCKLAQNKFMFSRDKSAIDNLCSTCKSCQRLVPLKNVERWTTNSPYEIIRQKYCPHCQQTFSNTSYSINRSRMDGLAIWCKSCENKAEKGYRQVNPANALLKSAKARAKKNKLSFTITLKDIVIPKTCPILGIELKSSCGRPSYSSPTIDRIDNSIGYIPDNIHVISWRANIIKHDATLVELKQIVAYLSTLK